MQIVGDLFNILLFVTMTGSLLTVLSCFLSRVLRLPLPLWFGICCMAAYIVPITAWGTWLIPPEEHSWIEGYFILCKVWAGGIFFLILLRGIRSFLGFQAFKACSPCEDPRILDCCDKCARLADLRRSPSVYWGELKNPACVLGGMRPAVILDKSVATQLKDRELMAVLCHEIMHVKRRHMALESVFDYICIINWLNPLAWIMKQEFSALCEMDCDRHTMAVLSGRITLEEYACALLRLLTLSSGSDGSPARGMGALGFLLARMRIRQIMSRRRSLLRIAGFAAGILGLILAVLFSLHMSRGYFYPYLSGPPEYAAATVSKACEIRHSIFLLNKTTFVI